MSLERDLVRLEERFWKDGNDFYASNLEEDALLAFPKPVGVLTKDEAIASLAGAPRWSTVRFDDVRVVSLLDDAAVLVYEATARREGDAAPYTALVSTTYVNRDGAWKLAFHQQSPLTMP